MRVFFDENFPPALVRGLALLRFDVDSVYAHDLAGKGTPDRAVVNAAREAGCEILITQDNDFHEQDLLAEAVVRSGLAVLTIVFPASYNSWEAIRDASLVLLDRLDSAVRRYGPQTRCRVVPPRGKSRYPTLHFSSMKRRR